MYRLNLSFLKLVVSFVLSIPTLRFSIVLLTIEWQSFEVSSYITQSMAKVPWTNGFKLRDSPDHKLPATRTKLKYFARVKVSNLAASRTPFPIRVSENKPKSVIINSTRRNRHTNNSLNLNGSMNPLIAVNEIRTDILGNRTMSQTEMMAMSVAGSALIFSVLFTLGGTGDGEVISVTERGVSLEALELVSSNIIDAALPMTVSDVVSVAIGEAIAGVIGAFVSFVVSFNMRLDETNKMKRASNQQISEAVADGDFLLTQAATIPILEGIGLTAFTASAASVLLAMVPFSLVKFISRRKQRLLEEDRILQQILTEQLESEERLRRRRALSSLPISFDLFVKDEPSLEKKIVNLNNLQYIQNEMDSFGKFDLVELFTDVAKWLQYSVLSSEFGDLIIPKGERLFPGEEGAIFGSIATISSQIYSDVLYGYFGLGDEAKRDVVRSRTAYEWSRLYLYKAVYAASLFGVYESVKAPARKVVNAFLSGGIDNCLGSADMQVCIETYVAMNPPGATLEAQLRGLFTAAYSIWSNYGFAN